MGDFDRYLNSLWSSIIYEYTTRIINILVTKKHKGIRYIVTIVAEMRHDHSRFLEEDSKILHSGCQDFGPRIKRQLWQCTSELEEGKGKGGTKEG